MGGHTKPPGAAKEFAGAAEQRAKGGREAQQAELKQQTGDTLYRSAGAARAVQSARLLSKGISGMVCKMLPYCPAHNLEVHGV